MNLVLEITIIVALVIFTIWGLLRGLQRSVAAIAGTLIAIVFVDLWRNVWKNWILQELNPESPALLLWIVTTVIFLLVALLIGYGITVRRERNEDDTPRMGPGNRLIGGLLGLLNGGLLIGYLLRYASELWPAAEYKSILDSSLMASFVALWLPLFVLALVVIAVVFTVLRGLVRLIRGGALRKPKTSTEEPTKQTTTSKPGATSATTTTSKPETSSTTKLTTTTTSSRPVVPTTPSLPKRQEDVVVTDTKPKK